MFLELSDLITFYITAVSVSVGTCLFLGFISWAVFFVVNIFKDASSV